MDRYSLMNIIWVLLGVMAIIYFFGASEDKWICRHGEWVQYGTPAIPKPLMPCR